MSTPFSAHRRTTVCGRTLLRPSVAMALAGVTAVLSLTGCAYEEAICSGGEYPVMTVGATGSACVADEQEPPKGYVRYPKGKVPRKVDDQWDVYWRDHTLDRHGSIIEVPEGD
ncbi:SCO0607 family lipoprotein [Streptomyces sp. NPDC007088]|uniref:SCO0607 family lipoprotein n=1 Tax=Streptomyces sp. NPDC007088 TaxID=3364773 RepID=UPI0036AB6B4C